MNALSKTWREWQAQRQADMIASGMSPDVAKVVSTREAIGRQRCADVIGDEAAMQADLAWRDQPDGTTKWYLVINPTDIPPERRAAAREDLVDFSPPAGG